MHCCGHVKKGTAFRSSSLPHTFRVLVLLLVWCTPFLRDALCMVTVVHPGAGCALCALVDTCGKAWGVASKTVCVVCNGSIT